MDSGARSVGRFDKCSDISQRYKGLSGNLLQQAVFDDYMIPNPTQRLKFFDSQSRPCLHRHPLNGRDHCQVREQYVRGILANGCLIGVRGQAWATPSTNNESAEDPHFQMMSSATLIEAVYAAHAREPTNAFVQKTLEAGVQQFKLFHPSTPDDVIIYLKELNNQFHRGAGTSFLEVMHRAPEVEKAWKAYCTEHTLTARSCPSKGPHSYEKQYWKFVDVNYKGVYKNWLAFLNAKVCVRGLSKQNLLQPYNTHMSTMVNFCHPKLNTEVALQANRDMLVTILENFASTIPSFHLNIIIMEALAVCVPKVVDFENPDEDPTWLIYDGKRIELIKRLKCPMGGALALESKKGKVAKPNQSAAKARPKKAGRGRGNGRGRGEPSSSKADVDDCSLAKKRRKSFHESPVAVSSEIAIMDNSETPNLQYSQEEVAEETPTTSTGAATGQFSRPKLFLDDLFDSVCGCNAEIPTEKLNIEVLKWCYRNGLAFAIDGQAFDSSLNACSTWSAVRIELRKKFNSTHDLAEFESVPTATAEVVPDGMTGEQLLTQSFSKLISQACENSQCTSLFFNFFETNDKNMPIQLHAAFTSWMQSVFSKIKFYREGGKAPHDGHVPLVEVIRAMADAFHDDPMNKLLEDLGGPITYVMCHGTKAVQAALSSAQKSCFVVVRSFRFPPFRKKQLILKLTLLKQLDTLSDMLPCTGLVKIGENSSCV